MRSCKESSPQRYSAQTLVNAGAIGYVDSLSANVVFLSLNGLGPSRKNPGRQLVVNSTFPL
jgi:hypothetical protein